MDKEGRRKFWNAPFKNILERVMAYRPAAMNAQNDISEIREWIYRMSSWLIRYPGSLVLLFGAWNFYQDGHPVVALFEMLIFILFWVFHVIPWRQAASRYLALTAALYVLSISHILYAGKDGTGFLLVLITFLLSGSLLPTRINGWMLSINVLVFLGLTAGQFMDAFQDIHLGDYGNQWIFHVLVLLLAIYIQYFLIRVFFTQFMALITRYDLAISGTDDGI